MDLSTIHQVRGYVNQFTSIAHYVARECFRTCLVFPSVTHPKSFVY